MSCPPERIEKNLDLFRTLAKYGPKNMITWMIVIARPHYLNQAIRRLHHASSIMGF
jgi:hypothetical protein